MTRKGIIQEHQASSLFKEICLTSIAHDRLLGTALSGRCPSCSSYCFSYVCSCSRFSSLLASSSSVGVAPLSCSLTAFLSGLVCDVKEFKKTNRRRCFKRTMIQPFGKGADLDTNDSHIDVIENEKMTCTNYLEVLKSVSRFADVSDGVTASPGV
eukprot:Awhi_evm1s8024